MQIREDISLSTLTTLRVGGQAKYVLECASSDDVRMGIAFAQERSLPFIAIGSGSNLLAPDSGYDGVVLHMRIPGLECDPQTSEMHVGAGVIWDELVTQTCIRGLWGLENLAAIPGTVGAAPVQNIGAYGVELKDTVIYVDAIDAQSGEGIRLDAKECAFGYRDSIFKQRPELVITHVGFKLNNAPAPKLSYKDLAARVASGEVLDTPEKVARAVREIRARKFPDLAVYGSAGSFFKNPVIARAQYESLKQAYPDLPGFDAGDSVKVPLAWILDNVLGLRDFHLGNASLFVHQPLVLVTEPGACAADVDALATTVAEKVFAATNISIEREVRSM